MSERIELKELRYSLTHLEWTLKTIAIMTKFDGTF